MKIDCFLSQMERLAHFFDEAPSDRMIADDLRIVAKPFWLLRSISRFCYRWDCFSYLHPNRVVARIESDCLSQRSYLVRHPIFIEKICAEILKPFDAKTKGNYPEVFRLILNLRSWMPKVPEKYLEVEMDQEDLGLFPAERNRFVRNFFEALAFVQEKPFSYELGFETTTKSLVLVSLQGWRDKIKERRWSILLDCELIYEESGIFIKEIVVHTQKIVGEGVDNKPRLKLYLIQKMKTVVKKCFNDAHCHVLKCFHHFSGDGVVPIHEILQIDFSEWVFEEPYYPMNLFDYFESRRSCSSWRNRLAYVERLLIGLQSIHQLSWKNPIDGRSYLVSHGDIKPDNILIDEKNGKIGIIDFGFSDPRMARVGTFGYISPEVESFAFHGKAKKEQIEFRQETGRAQDIWSMGLVLFMIFVEGKYFRKTVSLHHQLHYYPVPPLRPIRDGTLRSIRQKALDLEIDEWKEKEVQKQKDLQQVIERAFSLVKKMLRLAYQERISASQALLELRKMKT